MYVGDSKHMAVFDFLLIGRLIWRKCHENRK